LLVVEVRVARLETLLVLVAVAVADTFKNPRFSRPIKRLKFRWAQAEVECHLATGQRERTAKTLNLILRLQLVVVAAEEEVPQVLAADRAAARVDAQPIRMEAHHNPDKEIVEELALLQILVAAAVAAVQDLSVLLELRAAEVLVAD
jgi:hypothetical protein